MTTSCCCGGSACSARTCAALPPAPPVSLVIASDISEMPTNRRGATASADEQGTQ